MNFLPVYVRELRSYFTSPVAYVVMLFFLLLTGIFFMVFIGDFNMASMNPGQYGPRNLNVTRSVVRPLLGNMCVIMLFVMPLITMKPFAEERKSGTAELLFTYPLSDLDLLLGKFLAAFSLFAAMLAATLVYPLFIEIYSEPEAGTLISGYLGLTLMSMSFIALGLFISSLTENQIIAAIATFGMLLIFWIIQWTGTSPILRHLSVLEHFNNFAEGLIDTRDVVYYLSFTLLWMFLTLRVLESKMWRG
ncbi:MAG: ABC transporter permease subunit [Candidatus Glassbacteria bacterium]|nr:ABC transporter permease subunit [Candidatus Glassbacteria bacterium]